MKNTINLLALLVALVPSVHAEEKKSTMTVGATIVYNCQIIDEKNKQYCDKNVVRIQTGNVLEIRY